MKIQQSNLLLKFGDGNAKLIGQTTATFGIPAGLTCPGALTCHTWFDRKQNKLIDGPHSILRCFAATSETARPNVRRSNDHNLLALKTAGTTENMADLIHRSLPAKYWDTIRVHWSGDFFNEEYFLAWLGVAGANQDRMFYGYTTSVDILAKYRRILPGNFRFVASRGGKHDDLIDKYDLRSSRIIFHPDEAGDLPIDHDDKTPRNLEIKHFCLLIHGQGKAGSEQNKAMTRMRKEKISFSYPRGGREAAAETKTAGLTAVPHDTPLPAERKRSKPRAKKRPKKLEGPKPSPKTRKHKP